MRIRRLLLAGFVAAVPLLTAGAAAHAAEAGHTVVIDGTEYKLNEIGECKSKADIDKLFAAKSSSDRTKALEDCFSAPSPVIPKLSEVFWGGAAWLLVMLVVVKVGVPAIKKTMKAREDRIREDLEAADAAKAAANEEATQYRAQLGDARSEAARIIEEARTAADGVRRQIVEQAETEAASVRSRANDDIRMASERASADLRQQVASMSVELAGKIVERNLDQSAQQDLIDSFINRVGSN